LALVLALNLLGACSGISHETADHADITPPSRATFPPPTRSAPLAAPEPFVAGTFDLDVVSEASGVALSVRNPAVAYVLDDGPGSTSVIAVDTTTGASTTVTVEGLEGRDTEALAVGPCGRRQGEGERLRAGGRGSDGEGERQRARGRRSRVRTCLFIGDIGNNFASRETRAGASAEPRPRNQGAWESVRVWRVREPDLRPARQELTIAGDVATYTYPDEPVNAEAMLVEQGRPLLITKESRADSGGTPDPHLLAARRFADGRLRDLGPIPLPAPQAGGLAAAFVGNVVTGAELAGGRAVIRTYDHVLIYTPHVPNAPLRTLARWTPREVDTPGMPQGEGVAMDHCGVWLVSEQVDSIWLVPQPQSQPADPDSQEQACPTGTAPS
jgi:hypothetical protein